MFDKLIPCRTFINVCKYACHLSLCKTWLPVTEELNIRRYYAKSWFLKISLQTQKEEKKNKKQQELSDWLWKLALMDSGT